MAFTQKKVWHSHMRNHSPLVVRFKTGVLASQYLKDPELRIMYFDAAGQDPDDPDRMIVDPLEGKYYVIDDAGVREALEQVQSDQWVVLTCGGGKDDPAWVKIEPYTGPDPLLLVNGELVDGAVADTEKIAGRIEPRGNGSSVSVAVRSQDFSKANIEDTYYETLSLAFAMQERFQAEFEREMTFMDLELAQHLFAHWAIKSFDRPLWDGQQPKTGPVPEVPAVQMATQDHFNVIRDLAKLASGTNPAIIEQIEKKIEAGLTEKEAGAIIRDLTITT